jgi:hypothetical protein
MSPAFGYFSIVWQNKCKIKLCVRFCHKIQNTSAPGGKCCVIAQWFLLLGCVITLFTKQNEAPYRV